MFHYLLKLDKIVLIYIFLIYSFCESGLCGVLLYFDIERTRLAVPESGGRV